MPRTLYILLFCLALSGSTGLVMAPLLTDIAKGFDTSPATIGRAMAGYGAGTALTALWLGQSLDRIGVLRALRLALALGGIAMIGSGFATGWQTLLLAMFVAGLSSGVVLPACYAVTSAISPKNQENRYMARILLGWSIAMVAIVPLSGFAAEFLGWRLTLQLLGIAILIMLLPLSRLKPIRLTNSAPSRMSPLKPLLKPDGALIYGICMLWTIGFFGIYTYLGDYSRVRFDVSSGAAGLVAMAYGLGFGLAIFGISLLRRIGNKSALSLSLLIVGIMLGSMFLPPFFALLILLIGFWGLADHFLNNLLIVRMNSLAPENRGTVMGLYSGTVYFGASLGALLLGMVYDKFGFTGVALTMVGLHFIAFLLSRKLSETH